MAFTIPANGIELNTPSFKIFNLTCLEDDAVHRVDVFTFTGSAMMAMAAAPVVIFVQEVTPLATATIAATFAITAISALGFTAHKTSVGAASGIRHTFRVYMLSKKPFEL
jgi:hypothetical protein